MEDKVESELVVNSITMDKSIFWDEYQKLDKCFNVGKNQSYEYLVNFSQTNSLPIHRWFYYQEGYSPQLVVNILNYLGINSQNTFIFDPFAGSGTTLLVAKQMGMKSLGFEINPFSDFMIRAKTQNYNSNDIKGLMSFKPKLQNIDNVYDKYEFKIIRNLFDEQTMVKIESLKQEINKIEKEKVRNLLFAGLLSILEDVSNYRKGGNGLKKKRVNKHLDPLIEFDKKITQIGQDLMESGEGYPEPVIVNDSCLNLSNYSEIRDIDISIFSPPYANCFDPFEVYKMELWVGEFVSSYDELRGKRKRALTSNLNANIQKTIDGIHRTDLLDKIIEYLSNCTLWDKRIVQMLDRYFNDMYFVLDNIYQKTKKNGHCVIVVGNSAYGNLAIPTDIILAQIGKNVGFKVKDVIVARKNETSSQQHSKLGNFTEYLRESIVVLEK